MCNFCDATEISIKFFYTNKQTENYFPFLSLTKFALLIKTKERFTSKITKSFECLMRMKSNHFKLLAEQPLKSSFRPPTWLLRYLSFIAIIQTESILYLNDNISFGI